MSQNDIVLEALKRGPLTKLDAFRLGAGLSLNSRVAELRARGYDIHCRRIVRDGRPVWEYRLQPLQKKLFTDEETGIRWVPQKDESPQ
jgi:hypothetical protein